MRRETRLLNAIDTAKEEDIIRLIDEEHVDLNFEDENGATPLDHAIENDPIRKYKYSSLRSRKLRPTKTVGKLRTI